MITKTPSRASSLTSSACRVCPECMISWASLARFSAVSSTVESRASRIKKKVATPRTRSIAPIARAMNSVRRHLIGKTGYAPFKVYSASGRYGPVGWYPRFGPHKPQRRIASPSPPLPPALALLCASIPSPSYQCIIHLTCPVSGLHPQMSVFGALFIRVRGIGILGSSTYLFPAPIAYAAATSEGVDYSPGLELYGDPAFILSLAALFRYIPFFAFGAALALASFALRMSVGGATMTIPGGAGTTPLPGVLRLLVLGPPASLIRSELPTTQGSGLSLCPAPMPQGVSYVQISAAYIRNIIPSGGSCPSAVLADRSGAILNFAFTEF